MRFRPAERLEVGHTRWDRSPNGGPPRCQAGNARLRLWRSRHRVVSREPLGRHAWDVDVGIGRAGIVASPPCTRVQRLVFTLIRSSCSAHSLALGATSLRFFCVAPCHASHSAK